MRKTITTFRKLIDWRIAILIGLVRIMAVFLVGCGSDDPPPPPIVNNPVAHLTAVNGELYKGTMGSSTFDNLLSFKILDSLDQPIANRWVMFDLLEGDGVLAIPEGDSAKTSLAGEVIIGYTFDSIMGHAEVLATADSLESVNIELRANTLIPGPGGQGQYVLFDETLADVVVWNGDPASVDVIADHPNIYMDYEAALGMVVILHNDDLAVQVYDTTSVRGVIVNTIYPYKTADSIGVNSLLTDVVAAYGQPSGQFIDRDPEQDGYAEYGPSMRLDYEEIGSSFWIRPLPAGTDSSASTVFEIHITEYSSLATPPVDKPNPSLKPTPSQLSNSKYRLLKQ